MEAVLSVSREERSTILRYDGTIDFIGGVCVRDAPGRPMLVFQAYCGGSGCYDLDNWGIVDTEDLLVRLVPSDWKHEDAEKLLGRPLPQIDKMIRIRDEANKLGLKW